MFLLARPVLSWIIRRWGDDQQSRTAIALIFMMLLLAALFAEAIGIHAIFGAFLLGVIIPHDSRPARTLKEQLVPLVTILLLPAFFAFTGMRTRIDLLSRPADWLICGLIILVAMRGKFGGCFVAARMTGLGWRNAAMLGALMNTRGLMELIVLNIGLELRIISPTLFSMMVVMALVTTALTAPLLHLFRGMKNPAGTPDLLDGESPPYQTEAASILAAPSLPVEDQ
jgi:Kef-type K+ transport system membrane component KefB